MHVSWLVLEQKCHSVLDSLINESVVLKAAALGYLLYRQMALGLLLIGACPASSVVLSLERGGNRVDLSLHWYGTTPAVILQVSAWNA
jgi:hypothetical protein